MLKIRQQVLGIVGLEMFYSNANAKLGTLGGSFVMEVCRKRGNCLRYRGVFREGQRREVIVVDLRPMQHVAIELCTAHLETCIEMITLLPRLLSITSLTIFQTVAAYSTHNTRRV